MSVRLLGPLELLGADRRNVAVPGAQRRAVLALLALELGRTVGVNRFIELLWGDEPPVHARAALQGHIAALRKLLPGTGLTLATRPPGYQLDGDPLDVDVHRLASLVHDAAAVEDDLAAASRLRGALDQWTGEPLADLPDSELRRALAQRLQDWHTDAVTAWVDRLLRLGQGGNAIPLLEQQVLADGLSEPAVALLMRCLQQAGRVSDAVQVYHHARSRLREELGIVPGQVLRQALAEVLAERDTSADAPAGAAPGGAIASDATPPSVSPSPSGHAVPNQLPRRPASFIGRTAELNWLDRQSHAFSGSSNLALVVGPAGVGKTSTVVRWAHTVAQNYPDGRLFADLRGYSPGGPAEAADTLTRFLQALGVPGAALPADPDDRVALYRQQTSDRRLLVVLDNVRSAADVIDLLPAGEGSCTVVTSRNSLEDLVVTEGAALLRIDTLTESEALDLLRRVLTAERVDADPASARRVLALCDQLPLALRVASARLLGSPGWSMADLADYLDDERTRLRALDTGGEISVRSALNLTLHHLPAAATRLLGLLATHPGTEVDTFAAAALLDGDLPEARHALGSLAAYHLLAENSPGRYSRHDLIRLYGAELLTSLGVEAEQGGLKRLLAFFLAAVRTAAGCVDPHTPGYAPSGEPARILPQLPDIPAATSWFRGEEANIRALVEYATLHGAPEDAWRLASMSDTLYYCTDQITDRVTCLRAGLQAAQRSVDPLALPTMEAAVAAALNAAGHPEEALRLAERALARTGPQDGASHIGALVALATITAGLGGLDAAVELSDRALAALRASGLRTHAAPALANAAALRGVAGDPHTALRYARAARRLLSDRPSAPYQVAAMVNEAHALFALDRRDEAETLWIQAMNLCTNAGAQVRALAERQYAEFLVTVGRRSEAAGHLRQAIELYTVRGSLLVVKHLSGQLAELEQSV